MMQSKKNLLYFIAALWACYVYIFGIDQIYIPTIGDELVYAHMSRVTHLNGDWLPLKAEYGIFNTKPPLLIWQGILSQKIFGDYNLWGLRLPITLFTLFSAFLLYLFSRRIYGNKEAAVLSAFTYLIFFSTYKHGRNFLMQSPETLLMALPLILFYFQKRFTFGLSIFSGICFGLVCLYKSFAFALIGPASMSWMHLWFSRKYPKHFLLHWFIENLKHIPIQMGLSLSFFSLWILLDPDPQKIIDQFILGENVNKLGKGNYIKGMFSGSHNIFKVWLSIIISAGFFIYLPIVTLLNPNNYQNTFNPNIMTSTFKSIFKYSCVSLLFYCIFYTLPSHRQTNYILPAIFIFCIPMGYVFERIKPIALNFYFIFLSFIISLFSGMVIFTNRYFEEYVFSTYTILIAAFVFITCYLGLFNKKLKQPLMIISILSTFHLVTLVTRPFSKNFIYTSSATEEHLTTNKTEVYFPRNFNLKHERYRILTKGKINVKAYRENNISEIENLLNQNKTIAITNRNLNAIKSKYSLQVLGKKKFLYERHNSKEIKQIILGDLELLIGELLIISKK